MKILSVLFILLSLSAVGQRRKASDSASIVYQVPDTLKAIQWYAEIISTDFRDGFYGIASSSVSLGLQKQGKNKELVFRLNPQLSNGQLLAKGLQANELAPGLISWKYNWQAGRAYKLLTTLIVDSASRSTFYTGYIFLPNEQQWKLLASFKTTEGANFLKHPAIEIVGNGVRARSAGNTKLSVQQAWLQRTNGSWFELREAVYKSNKSQGSTGTDSGRIFITDKSPLSPFAGAGTLLYASANIKSPLFSVTNHVDSLEQAAIDKTEIIAAVADAKLDTTGSVEHVYYKVLQEGKGELVKVTDSLSVFYKGWLLKDGLVFDQTKDKPAKFPLGRLIKGWQYGLTRCKVGGKIRLIIPSGLGYSIRSRSKDIPPNSVLVFDIEVLEAKPAG